MGKPPPLAVRLEKALPFRRWVAARASCGGAPRPRPRPNPKHNAESDGQEAHHTMRKSAKRGRGATYASQPQEGCPLLHPLQGASCLSTPLQGGILKPPALRVVDDWLRVSRRANASRIGPGGREQDICSRGSQRNVEEVVAACGPDRCPIVMFLARRLPQHRSHNHLLYPTIATS